MLSTSSTRCSIIKIDIPSSASSRTSSRVSCDEAGSKLASGSSNINTCGRIARTPAKATFCFSPPDRLNVSRPFKSRIRRWRIASSTRLRISSRGRLKFSRPKATSFNTLVPRICRSGSWRTVPTRCEMLTNDKSLIDSPQISI